MQTQARHVVIPEILRISRSGVCAVIATSALACGGDVEPTTIRSPELGCATAVAGDPWWSQGFEPQTGKLHVDLDATPSASGIDAVIGLGDGAVTSFAGLAAAVRFNPSGTIDVRDGAGYRADVALAYVAGNPYHIRLDVDVAAHVYNVWVRPSIFQGFTLLAHRYAFRTEQAGALQLSSVAAKVDGDTGSATVCGISVSRSATPSQGCLLASAGDGFVSAAVSDLTGLGTAAAVVTPSSTPLDAVIGLSAGAATSFAALATSLRLGPTGTYDARDGDVYRADRQVRYSPGSQIDIRMIVDLSTHTYSAYAGGSRFADEIGRGYAFRTQQRTVDHLDHLSVIVDGDAGGISVCNSGAQRAAGVVYQREDEHTVVPLPGDGALLGDGVTIRRVDAAGRTLAERPGHGALAVDPQGNALVAHMEGSTLFVDKYDPALAPVWSTPVGFFEGTAILAMTTDAQGNVGVAVRAPADSSGTTVIRLDAHGTELPGTSTPGEVVALDGDDVVAAWNQGDAVWVGRFSPSAGVRWLRSFPGRAGLSAIIVDPAHAVILAGELATPIDFGGGVLTPMSNPDAAINGFVVKLAAEGSHVFSTNTRTSWIGGVAASATRVVVSSTLWTQFPRPVLQWFDAAGTPVARPDLDVGYLGDLGKGDAVALAPSGRAWWNLRAQWPVFPEWPFLVALAP